MANPEDPNYAIEMASWYDARLVPTNSKHAKGALIIESAEGNTQFKGFTKESNPEAYNRLQAKLGELAERGPIVGSPELD
jgi:hypothetical protein